MSPIREEESLADLTLAQLLTVLRLDSLNIEHEPGAVCHVAVQWLEAAPRSGVPARAGSLQSVSAGPTSLTKIGATWKSC